MNQPQKADDLRFTLEQIGIVAPEIIELFDYVEDVPLLHKKSRCVPILESSDRPDCRFHLPNR